MFKGILFEKANGIGRITLNRPDLLNALDLQTLGEVEQVVMASENDPGVRVLVITGMGRAFCAGGDLKSFENIVRDPRELEHFQRDWHRKMNNIENSGKATIARINGMAFAGGLELTYVCDFAIADENAKIGDQHANFGLVPGGACSRLPRLIGLRKAKELLYTGAWITGREAERLGLVNKAVPAEQLDSAVDELATSLANHSVVATRTMKGVINRGIESDLYTSLDLERTSSLRHCGTEDFMEGIAAFSEKRKPVFKGI